MKVQSYIQYVKAEKLSLKLYFDKTKDHLLLFEGLIG